MSAWKTLKGSGAQFNGMSSVVNTLQIAFPKLSAVVLNTKTAFMEATTKGEKFKSILTGIKSGIEGMSTGGKIALFAIAIGIFTKAMQYIMDASNRAEEETIKTAEKSKQAVSELEQQQKSLKDLVSQYKTLAAQSKKDLSVRAELKSVQEQINKLVGGEIDGLDLVNGKLDEQLKKIKEKAMLEATDNNDVYTKATQDAIKSAENTTMYDGRGFDMEKTIRVRFVDVSDKNGDNNPVTLVDNAFIKALEDAGIKADISMPEDNGDSSSFALPDNVVERYEAVKQIVQWLKENGYTATDVWEKFIDAETRLKKAIDGVRDSTTEEANNVLFGSNNMLSSVNDLDDYVKMRDKLIEEVKQSPGVADALDKGFVDEDWINNTVDNYLGGLEQYSDIYDKWADKFKSDTGKKIEELKKQYEDSEFNKWVDALDIKDRELVVRISTTFTSDEVKKQLEAYSKGGSVDLLLRPTIDNSELNKAGWTDENGNPLPEGKATVNTSTYSINDGQANAKALNFTPIMVDEDGNYKGTLSPEALEKYAMDVLNGVREDDLHLQIGGEWTGVDAIDKAVDAAKKIHQYQNFYYLGGDKRGSETAPLETYQQTLDEYRDDVVETADTVEKNKSKIKSIFESKGSDEDKTFGERVKTYRENITSLNEAFAKFKNGEMDEDTFRGLVEKFPQLADRASDLDVAIISLMDDMDSDIASDFEAQFGKLETQEDIDALREYERQVLSTRDTSKKFKSSIENVVSAFQTVKGVMDDYYENGYLTLSNLQSILALDDRYINTLTNEQGALDLSTESYKRLVQAELTELKAQALQDSIDAVNKIENKAQALIYLEGAQASSAQASLDLADAQWQEALATAAVKDLEQGTGDLYQRTVIAARQAYETKAALIDSYAKTALTVGELTVTTDDYTKALNNEKDALENSKKALEDQKGALEDTKQGYEDALDSVKDLVGWVQNYIKQIKNDEIDALEKKKDTIDGLIDKQKELLDAEKEEYEWNKTITEKQNTVAKDALAASIASLDDSSAGRKSQKEANDKLSESRADMLDTLYDHEIEQRKKALDDLKEEQDEYYDSLISEIQDYLGDEVRLYKDACEMIDNDSGDLYAKLLWYCQNYTTTSEAEFNHMWNSAQSAMQQYNTANLGTFELLNDLQGRIYEVDNAIDTVAQSISSYESAIDGVQGKLDNLSKSAQKAISDIQAAANAEDEWTKPKWVYSWQGNDYKSWKVNRDAAISDIIKQIESRYGGVLPASVATIYGTIRKYASGTNSALGGVSLVGERGAELRVLNRGDGILKNQIVRGLTALGTNPAQFLAEAGQKMLATVFGSRMKSDFGAIAGAGSISPSINIVVQGDATQSTVNALKAQAQKIMNDTLRLVQADTLKRTHSNRVR